MTGAEQCEGDVDPQSGPVHRSFCEKRTARWAGGLASIRLRSARIMPKGRFRTRIGQFSCAHPKRGVRKERGVENLPPPHARRALQ